MEKIVEKFINEQLKNGTYASREDLREVVSPVLDIIKNYPEFTPEEWMDLLVEENAETASKFMYDHLIVPGFSIGANYDNISAELYGYTMDNVHPMHPDALFDVASITKLYTIVVAYNLMAAGAISYDDKISDLDPRFKNLGNLTVSDITTFGSAFKTLSEANTAERISDYKTIEEAKECVYRIRGERTPDFTYNYNDMGMIVLKEVMEHVTGKDLDSLVKEYITNPLSLESTFLTVPQDKYGLITGTPNAKYGLVNDQNAIALGGYSGHAGIIVSNRDLFTFGSAISEKLMPTINGISSKEDLWTRGLKLPPGRASRGMAGPTYIPMEEGLPTTLISTLSPRKSFAGQGSTRCQMNAGKNWASTSMLNPCSITYEQALELLDKEKRQAGKSPYIRNGKEVEYTLIDGRILLPIDDVAPITEMNAKLILRMALLSNILKEYYKFNEKVKVKRRVS